VFARVAAERQDQFFRLSVTAVANRSRNETKRRGPAFFASILDPISHFRLSKDSARVVPATAPPAPALAAGMVACENLPLLKRPAIPSK
jgi:hypothetical protein